MLPIFHLIADLYFNITKTKYRMLHHCELLFQHSMNMHMVLNEGHNDSTVTTFINEHATLRYQPLLLINAFCAYLQFHQMINSCLWRHKLSTCQSFLTSIILATKQYHTSSYVIKPSLWQHVFDPFVNTVYVKNRYLLPYDPNAVILGRKINKLMTFCFPFWNKWWACGV